MKRPGAKEAGMSESHSGFSYEGKRSLVVGCFSGMGESTAKIVQGLGGEVHGIDYKSPDYELASFTSCDLRDPAAIDSMLGSLQGPFHAVFYCAGLPPTHPAVDVMRVNVAAVRTVVEGVQPLVPSGGAISIISSTGGLGFLMHMEPIMELLGTDGYSGVVEWSEQHADIVADGYVFSKEVIIVYTMKRALEVVDSGVRVNCISPGPTQTPMMPDFEKTGGVEVLRKFEGPMKRKALPDEMGWALAFLNSDAASFVNGFNLVLDGGFLAGTMTGAIDVAALLAS
jgi:NAD(P)-dependent dehydrogenase (short-subunit alcohol dehydrogenase family)